MSEASTAHTAKRRRNPFLETASEPTPDPIDYAHGQRAPHTLAAYARPIRVRWGVHHRERHLDCRRPGASAGYCACLLHVLEALADCGPDLHD